MVEGLCGSRRVLSIVDHSSHGCLGRPPTYRHKGRPKIPSNPLVKVSDLWLSVQTP